MPKKLPYRIVESREIYRGYHIRLVKDRFILDVAPHKVVTRELVQHPGAVVIVPFIDKKHILLLRQFRYSTKGDLFEIPAGTIEKREAPLRCAKRELEEETGYKAYHWNFLTRFYPAPGISNEVMTLFKAESLKPGRKSLDHDEWIEHEVVAVKDVLRMIQKGKIKDGKTILGLLWTLQFRTS